MITDFIQFIPKSLENESGSVFYSGRNAFRGEKKLYVLGLNPGGSPQKQAKETVLWHTNNILTKKPDDWSEYQDESWLGKPAGTHGLQPRVLHMFHTLHLNPHHTPSSNLIFLRSVKRSDINFNPLAQACWSFHEQVIKKLSIQVILCFGKDTGSWVCQKLKANRLADKFIEDNKRKWTSSVYENEKGLSVVIATHPSRVNWQNPKSDPTPLLNKALKKTSNQKVELTENPGGDF